MKLSKLTLLLSLLIAPLGAIAAERLYLESPVQFGPNIFIVPRVKSECDVERHMTEDAEAGIKKRYGHIELAAKGDNIGNDKVVKLTILIVDGIGGGGWTGPKSITVLAELKQGDKMLDSKTFSRASKGGINPFEGTCGVLQKVTQAIGADVGIWLKRGVLSLPAEGTDKSTDDPT